MKNRRRIYASISADVVDSTSLTLSELKQLHSTVNSVLRQLDSIVTPVWGRIVRGDTVECILNQPTYALRVAVALKCYLKFWMSTVGASPMAKDYSLRYSIGVGTMREVDIETGFLDGAAIYMSGRNLDKMKSNCFAVFDCETDCSDFVDLVDMNISLLDSIINDLSAKQAIVVYYKLLRFPELAIARDMGISQTAVNLRSTSGHWNLISKTFERFENLNFEKYVL